MGANELDSVLAESLALLESGALTYEQCLDRFGHVEGLAELLSLAVGIRAVDHPKPSEDWFAASRARLEEAARPKSERLMSAIGPAVVVTWAWNWSMSSAAYAPPLVALRVAAVIAVLALLGSTGIAAAADSLPGSPLYSLKLAAEEARFAATFDPAQRAVLHLERAERRLAEVGNTTGGAGGAMATAQSDVRAALRDLERAAPERRLAADNLLRSLTQREAVVVGVLDRIDGHALVVDGLRLVLDEQAAATAAPIAGARLGLTVALAADGEYHVRHLTVLPATPADGLRSESHPGSLPMVAQRSGG